MATGLSYFLAIFVFQFSRNSLICIGRFYTPITH